MTCSRRLFLTLTALASVLALAVAAAAPATPTRKGQVIVSPKPGQVVRANTARIAIRAKGKVLVRLNGRDVSRELGRGRRGVRRFQASISQGLRQGSNVLTVRIERGKQVHRAKVRFQVRSEDPLVGAGRDNVVGIGDTFRLAGLVGPGGSGQSLDWTPVEEPENAVRGCPAAAPTVLRSPSGQTATFRPRIAGDYVFRLRSAGGARDTVEVEASPANRLSPIETMIGDGSKPASAGIRVGAAKYLLSQATVRPGADNSGLQVLVLARETLECISNTKYASVAELSSDLRGQGMNSSKLVIVAMQPGATGSPNDGKGLYDALGSIGFPKQDGGTLPVAPGSFSGVGVPGLNRGDADVDILPGGSKEDAKMVGYLTPDQFGNFGFVPSAGRQYVLLSQEDSQCGTDKAQCEAKAGFFLRDLDKRTLAPGPNDKTFFNTGAVAKATEEARRLGAALYAIPAGNVVELESRSARMNPSQQYYLPPLAKIDKGTMEGLANAVAGVGGTRNAFNKVATAEGQWGSYGLTYALVGWKGAAEGEGAESAQGVDGEGVGAGVSGVLRPNRRSLMRPAVESSLYPRDDLAKVVMEPPTTSWPLENNPAAMKAFTVLAENHPLLGGDPRTAYWNQPLEPAKWESLAKEIEKETYAGLKPEQRQEFTEKQFAEGRNELAQELKWVANVREYLGNLSKPFEKNIFNSWAEAQSIADEIFKEAHAEDSETTVRWLEYTSIILKLIGPATGHITNEVGEAMDLGVWAFGADAEGRPTYDGVSIKAHELGKELSGQMQAAAETYRRMGDVIVSDPKKLELIGRYGGCNPGNHCREEFSFTEGDRRRVAADLYRATARFAWERLLPTTYHVYKLNPDREPSRHGGKPQDPHHYECGVFHPWYYFESLALQKSVANLLLRMQPGGTDNNWQILVLARESGGEYGYPPSDETLTRLFSPVAEDNNPHDGGLGMSPEAFISEQPWVFWDENPNEPGGDACYWDN